MYAITKYDNTSVANANALRKRLDNLEKSINDRLRDSREKSCAITKLDELRQWLGSAVAADQLLREKEEAERQKRYEENRRQAERIAKEKAERDLVLSFRPGDVVILAQSNPSIEVDVGSRGRVLETSVNSKTVRVSWDHHFGAELMDPHVLKRVPQISTCREWVAANHPENMSGEFGGGVKDCPCIFFPHAEAQCSKGCAVCWDQPIPKEDK